MSPEEMARLHGASFERGWSVEAFNAYRRDRAVCIATDQLGFALARVVADEAELLTIVVAPEARGQRFGQRLLDDLIDQVRTAGAAQLFLDVAADNPAAQALYARSGFAEVGRRRGYYPRPDGAVDALLMRKAL